MAQEICCIYIRTENKTPTACEYISFHGCHMIDNRLMDLVVKVNGCPMCKDSGKPVKIIDVDSEEALSELRFLYAINKRLCPVEVVE